MANISPGTIRANPDEFINQRRAEICEKEKAKNQKTAMISKVVFVVLGLYIVPGKLIHIAERALNKKVEALANKVNRLTNHSFLVGIITGLFQLTYAVPAFVIRSITMPASKIFDLLRYRINTEISPFHILSLLFVKASKDGDIDSLQILLAGKDTTVRHKNAALLAAILHSQQDAVNLLLNHIEVEKLSQNEKDAFLQAAIRSGDLDRVKDLVDRLKVKTTNLSGELGANIRDILSCISTANEVLEKELPIIQKELSSS